LHQHGQISKQKVLNENNLLKVRTFSMEPQQHSN
jgi:hypothetical protein